MVSIGLSSEASQFVFIQVSLGTIEGRVAADTSHQFSQVVDALVYICIVVCSVNLLTKPYILPSYFIISHDVTEEHLARVWRSAALRNPSTIITTLPGVTHRHTSTLCTCSITLQLHLEKP